MSSYRRRHDKHDKRRRPPALHDAEDFMQKQFLSLKASLDLYGELEKLPKDPFVKAELKKTSDAIRD